MAARRQKSLKLLRGDKQPALERAQPIHRRAFGVSFVLLGLFLAIIAKLVSFGVNGGPHEALAMMRTLSSSLARPDIIDRNGRLLATDISMPSLYADPKRIIDVDEVAEKLSSILVDITAARIREKLSNRKRRFVWLKRGVAPAIAQRIHNLGLPGLGFRNELKRIYPAGQAAGHLLGLVNIDNRGISGIERYIDEEVGVAVVHGPGERDREPVRMTIDLRVQHALRRELDGARKLYKAKAAGGVVIDASSGEVIAMSSLPDFDPNQPKESLKAEYLDRMTQGVFELGSVFKAVTIALALDSGVGTLKSRYDARKKIAAGRHQINDSHGAKRILSMREVFLYSSNIGAARMGTDLGRARLKKGLGDFGLLKPLKTEIGRTAKPRLPKHWGEAEMMTFAFGHGLAVTPFQFAVSALPLVNGGYYMRPRFVLNGDAADGAKHKRILKRKTSAAVRGLMRENVMGKIGTGKRARVGGYNVGGKTGTAEMPGKGGYQKDKVVTSFIGAFPMDAPKYVTYVVLFEPQGTPETKGGVGAGLNAAPLTAKLIGRIAPLLKELPRS